MLPIAEIVSGDYDSISNALHGLLVTSAEPERTDQGPRYRRIGRFWIDLEYSNNAFLDDSGPFQTTKLV